MSLVKLPCVLVATIGIHLSLTPPHYEPSDNEKAPILDGWDRFMKVTRDLIWPIKAVYWAVGIAEIITIIADHMPLVSCSERVLSALLLYRSTLNPRITPLSAIGLLFIIFGTLVQLTCHRAMGHLFTPELSICTDHMLITNGPYSVVRHPSYAGLLVLYIGMFCWYGSRGSWLVDSGVLETMWGGVFAFAFAAVMMGILIGLIKRMSTEDEALREVFGYEWVVWAERVPYSLIPWIY